jgi:hypothetical protein
VDSIRLALKIVERWLFIKKREEDGIGDFILFFSYNNL